MHLWEYLFLFLSVILGGGLAFYVRQQSSQYLKWVLSASGAYILGISVLHLMPTVFVNGDEKMGLWVLLGFFIQLVLEQFSGGVEHGHIHAHKNARHGFALQIMLGLSIHAFIEGMPLGSYSDFHHTMTSHNHDSGHLLWGIILHKAPAAFALVLLLLESGFKRNFIFVCILAFALMSPSGAALSDYLYGEGLLNPEALQKIIAVVIGSFLHIATTIIFEVDSSSHHKISWSRLLAILIGVGGALLTL